MIGGVFLLSRDPEALANWYRRHFGWELGAPPWRGLLPRALLPRGREPKQRQHLVFAMMPDDPGNGEGHIINYRVGNIEAVVASLRKDGIEISQITVGPDAEGEGKFARQHDPDGHRIELWEHL